MISIKHWLFTQKYLNDYNTILSYCLPLLVEIVTRLLSSSKPVYRLQNIKYLILIWWESKMRLDFKTAQNGFICWKWTPRLEDGHWKLGMIYVLIGSSSQIPPVKNHLAITVAWPSATSTNHISQFLNALLYLYIVLFLSFYLNNLFHLIPQTNHVLILFCMNSF